MLIGTCKTHITVDHSRMVKDVAYAVYEIYSIFHIFNHTNFVQIYKLTTESFK